MNCPTCEQPAPQGAVECPRCGSRLAPIAGGYPAPQPGGYPAPHPGYAAPYPQFSPSPVSGLGRALTGMLFISAMGQAAQVGLTSTSGPRQAVTILNLLLFIAIASVFLVWFYRVRKNAGMWGPQTRSQGWTIGAWFTPVVNLWFPVQIMRDVWRASSVEPGDGTVVARLTAGWWTCWILAWLTGFHTYTLSSTRADGSIVVTKHASLSLDSTFVSAVFLGLAALLMERVITKITAMQTARGIA